MDAVAFGHSDSPPPPVPTTPSFPEFRSRTTESPDATVRPGEELKKFPGGTGGRSEKGFVAEGV